MRKVSFEKALETLELLVAELEDGELSLDDAMKKYEEGLTLTRECSRQLKEAEKKVELLMKNKEGDFETEDFDDAPRVAKKTIRKTTKKKIKKQLSDDDLLFS